MRSIYFFFVIFVFVICTEAIQAQTTVTIGTGTSTDYSNPFETYFNYGWSSQLYLKSEIGAAGSISAIGYYVTNSGSSYTLDNQKIYIRHSSIGSFTDKYYPGTTGFTLVYSGSITFGSTGWKTIPLSMPFSYNGIDNLEILIESRDGSSFTSTVQSRYTSQSGGTIYRTKYDYNDYSFPSTYQAGGRIQRISNLQLSINTCTYNGGVSSATLVSVCSGGSTTISLSGNTGTPIQWQSSLENSTFIDEIGATSSNYVASGLIASKYYRAKIGSGSCIVNSTSTLVSVKNIPNAPNAGSNGPVCAGAPLDLLSSSVIGATYLWTGPNGFSSTSQNPSVSFLATTSMSGTYSVTASVNGCVSSVSTTNVTVNTIPTIPTLGNNSPLCTGLKLSLSSSIIPNATYHWTGPNNFISSNQNPDVSENATELMSGIYSLVVSENGCSTPSLHTIVSILSGPKVNLISKDEENICPGTSVVLSSVFNENSTITWYKKNNTTNEFIEIIGENSKNLITEPIIETTIYKYLVSNGTCSSYSLEYPVSVNCKAQVIVSSQDGLKILADITSISDKVGPFKFILSKELIPSFNDFVLEFPNYANQGVQTSKYLFDNLEEGQYNLKVFDSRGVALIDNQVNVFKPIEFITDTELKVNGNKIYNYSNVANGSTTKVITERTRSKNLYKINTVDKIHFLGFQDLLTGSSTFSDVKFGYYFQDNKVYAIENGTPKLLDILPSNGMTLGLVQTEFGFDYTYNGNVVLQAAYRNFNFTFNETFELFNRGELVYLSEDLEWRCYRCPPEVKPKSSLNNCLDKKGSIEFNITAYDKNIIGFKLFSASNELISPDISSTDKLYLFSNLEPGIYTYQYQYKWVYDFPYWRNNNQFHTFSSKVKVDSKMNWTNFIDMEYTPVVESVFANVSGSTKGSVISLNETWDDIETYYIEFSLKNSSINWRRYSTRILTWNPDFSISSIAPSDLKIIYSSFNTVTIILGGQTVEVYYQFFDDQLESFNSSGYTRFRYNYTPSSNAVSVQGFNEFTNQWQLLINNVSVNFLGKVHNVKFNSDTYGFGITNVSTNLHCNIITYAKLEKDLKGVNYKPKLNKIYFYFDEEYSGNNTLTYKVYDKKNRPVLYNQLISLNKKYGDNRYDLDVSTLQLGSYILEVMNEKNEKFYLRFTK